MITDDGGCIPAQYQDFTISRSHNIKVSQYSDFTIFRFHNINMCLILVRYKDYVDICGKDLATFALHLPRRPKGIGEEEQFWVDESRKSVRGHHGVTQP